MKLDYEEFYDYVWNEYVSYRVVPDKFFHDNEELIKEVTYNIYHVYKQSENVSETLFAKIIEQTFRSVVRIGVRTKKDNNVNDAYESF